ncbi:hypothetical protein DAEQUDRAFT_765516 [Daedalea quercina L-15889]|uniref:DUF6535 domain-containing protein n=1 Tax=Daedalea quercina L-15889 TaxID=1314783 RepID=A0A165QGH5_9APHY|nr:hypothetical protein DAEQUDRAFT_765516 [Daedalea quercina L-15889]
MASLRARLPTNPALYRSRYRRLASSFDPDTIILISSSNEPSPQDLPHHSEGSVVNSQSRPNLVSGHLSNSPNGRNPTLTSDTSGAWAICAEEVWKHEEVTIQNWKEEIDIMLVLAGLFSAIVATFNAQYFPNMQPSMVAVNGLWFSGLVFSLAAASIGISVKQWLEHYVVLQSVNPWQRAQMWHSRPRGLLNWRVPEIITLIPLLLQLALTLFLVGLQILLWTISSILAGIVVAPIVLLLAFTMYTMIAPTNHSALHADLKVRPPDRLGNIPVRGQGYKAVVELVKREKAKLRHLGEGEESLDVLVAADKFIGGDIFLEQVVKPCLIQADTHSALPIFYRILQERAHLVDLTAGQRPTPKWLADEMDNGSVIVMGKLALEMLRRVGMEGGEGDRLRDEPRILDLLVRLLSATPLTDYSVYERLVVWFVIADLSPASRKEALALILRNAHKFLPDHPELCVSLGHMCLDMIEQLHKDGSDPQAIRQRSVLHVLDHVLFATPGRESSVYDRLCGLVQSAGISQEAGDEMVDIVYRYSGHFSSSESNVQILNSCVRPLQEDDNLVPGMSLLSAILTISARLPVPDFNLIENALLSATGIANPDTVNIIVQKMDSKDACDFGFSEMCLEADRE